MPFQRPQSPPVNRDDRLPRDYFISKGNVGDSELDHQILEDVWSALQNEGDIDHSEIEVDVRDGIVTLMGTLPNKQVKSRIENAVTNLPGVENVQNRTRVLKKFTDVEVSSNDDDENFNR